MKPAEALRVANSVVPLNEEKEYQSILDRIKLAAERGDKRLHLMRCPSENNFNKLKKAGYKFLQFGGSFYFPIIYYVISWEEVKVKKPKWYQRIFKKNNQ